MHFLRNAIKRHFKRAFEIGQRFGIDILPRHFYSSIPDFRSLRRDDSWRKPYEMLEVAGAELDGQIAMLREWMTEPARSILKAESIYQNACTANGEPGYGQSDADVLFAFIFKNRPAKIVQIGC